MKKGLLVLSLMIAAVSCSPLRIAMNTQTPKGERVVLTSDVRLFDHMDMALGVRIMARDTVAGILLTSDIDTDRGIFDKDDRLLIKMDDNSVIELKNLYDKEFETETSTNYTQDRISRFGYGYCYNPWCDAVVITPYEVSSFVPRVYTTKTTKSYALYLINWEQMQKIMNGKVVKLRVEVDNADLDMPRPENFPKNFKALVECLYEGVLTPVRKSDF